MEDEKKQASSADNGHNRHPRNNRHKSYFIEPAGQGAPAQKPQIRTEKAPEAASAQKPAQEQKAGGNHSKRHNRHRRSNHNQVTEEKREAIPATAPASQENAQPKEQNRGQNQNQNRNRNQERNHNRNGRNQNQNQNKQNQNQNQNKNQSKAQNQAPGEGGESNQGGRNRHRDRRHNQNRRNEATLPSNTLLSDTLLTDSLSAMPDPKKNAFAEPAVEEEIIPYVPADDDDLTGKQAIPEDAPRVEVIGIRFKASGKIYYFDPNGNQLTRGGYAIVETARGQEYGEVAMGNTMVCESDIVPPLRPVLRGATPADVRHQEENKKKEEDAFRVCNEKILAHGLDMKLIDAQYTFDNTKLLFYFTSSGRVDFRELVKDLASVFRTRIELRQIGIRDEAKMMGGLGPCGRPLCCTLFLTDFGQVSIKMAKEQNLSLNSSKISGICGRLMCCLRYEYETYEYEIKRTPPVDSLVKTEDGVGVVTEMNPLAGTVKVRLTATPDVAPKVYKRDNVVVLQRKQDRQDKQEKSDKAEKAEKTDK